MIKHTRYRFKVFFSENNTTLNATEPEEEEIIDK